MSDEPRAPLTTTTSIWPAAGVLIFAVVMVAIFMIINLTSDQGVSPTSTTLPVVVGGLLKSPSSAVLRYSPQPSITPTNSASLLNFYKTQLEALGWSLFSQGSSNGSPQSLFQKAGNDGFYWVAGITVTKSSSDLVHWTFRIYQNSETV